MFWRVVTVQITQAQSAFVPKPFVARAGNDGPEPPPQDEVTLGDRFKGALGGAAQGLAWGIPTGLVCGTLVALPSSFIVALATHSPGAATATLLGVLGAAIPLGVLGYGIKFAHQGWQEGKSPDTTIYAGQG